MLIKNMQFFCDIIQSLGWLRVITELPAQVGGGLYFTQAHARGGLIARSGPFNSLSERCPSGPNK